MGRVMNEIGSYDYMDNEKYKRIEKLIEVMKENFGFQVEDDSKAAETPKPAKDHSSSEATDNEDRDGPRVDMGTLGSRKRSEAAGTRHSSNKTVPKHSGSEFGTFSREGQRTNELSKYN